MSDLATLQAGTVFGGDFRVIQPLSRGGMGAVYVVEQISTGKRRALKLMLPDLVADPVQRKRFEQEARVGALIESEHVVEVVGAGVDVRTGVPWLAMELLNGEDLAHVGTRRGPLAGKEALAIFEQLCHAVGAAHAAGIVHRDLKPENVFLAKSKRASGEFTVKVLDFGIAKIVAEAKTARTAAIGSPMWMAPEQTSHARITPATDVWALGLIAFNLLTGRFFWTTANTEEATVPQLLREILFEPIPAASQRASELRARGSLPAGFDEWFTCCVCREPAARFQDAQQVLVQLRLVLSGGGFAHAPTGVAPTKAVERTERAAPIRVPVAATVDDDRSGATVLGSGTGLAGAYTLAEAQDGSRAGRGVAPTARSSRTPLYAMATVALGLASALVVVVSRQSPTDRSAPTPSGGLASAPAAPSSNGATLATPTATVLPGASVAAAAPMFVKVRVNSDPDGASVREDGVELCGTTPCEILYRDADADPSREHKLTLARNGYRMETRAVKVGDSPVMVKLTVAPGGGYVPRPAMPDNPTVPTGYHTDIPY